MAAYKISEQQFRVRRRDRRMVWVDALAFGLGLLIVVASVGGVIFVEPEARPYDWNYSFAESRLPDNKICMGYVDSDAARVGCQPPLRETDALEGEVVEYAGPKWIVQAANVTSVTFELTWFDELPLTGDECDTYCGRDFHYDENSTDELRLEVTAPWGETFIANGTNGIAPYRGVLRIHIPILQPESGTMVAYSQEEVLRRLNETNYVADHRANGQWRTVVTVVRAGDIEGTVPPNACAAAIDKDQQDSLGIAEHCDIYDEWNTVGTGQPGPAGTTIGFYPFYNQVPEGFREQLPYRSTYVDPGTSWNLGMTVRTYQAVVSL
jgi:hypothetical protein